MKLNNKTSKRLFKKAQNYLVGGVNSPVRSFNAVQGSPLFISKAKGPYIYDEDGNKFIDYIGSWGPLILGHSDKDVVSAIKKTASKGTSYGAPCELEIEVAKLVVKSVPSIEKVRMTNSGTEATMSAIRLARAYTGNDYIVKFEGCYHGHPDYLLVKAGSGATTFGNPSSPGVPKSFTDKTLLAKYGDINSVEKLFKKYPDNIAGIIIEPVCGNMGVVVPEKKFLADLKRITKKHKSLLIFDEVMTGFRLDMGGVQKRFGVIPDITCLGKIIGGGLPVGAYGASKKIMKMVSPEGPMYQAGTLSGNPLAMSAGFATLKKLNSKTYKYLEDTTAELVDGIEDIISKSRIDANINQIGSMFTIFFTKNEVVNYKSALKCDTKKYGAFFKNLLENGVMFPPSQFEAVFVSTSHTKKEVNKTLDAVYKSFKDLN